MYMKSLRCALAAALVAGGTAMVCGQSLLAATVHVSPSGSDANPGTLEQPVVTVSKALGLVLGKEEPCEVILHKGVYPGGVTVGQQLERNKGPLPLLLITAAKNADGSFEDVLFDGGRKISESEPVAGKPGVFKAPGAYDLNVTKVNMWEADARIRYTLVADLTSVQQFPASFWCDGSSLFVHTSDGRAPATHEIGITGIHRDGITVWRQNTTIRGLHFRSFLVWGWSAGVTLRAANSAVEDCQAWNCEKGFQSLDEGVADMRIIRCRSDDCFVGAYLGSHRGVVEDCRFIKIRDRFMIRGYPQEDCGIKFYYPGSEGTARRNLCVGFDNGIFVKRKVSTFTCENNTSIDCATYGIGGSGYIPQSLWRLNIVVGSVWVFPIPENLNAGTVMDYNCYWRNSEKASFETCVAAMRKAGTGEHNLVANPRFAGPATGDYRLLPGSPCLKMGPGGENCGAFGVVGPDFKDVEPPVVAVTLAPPAKRSGGAGELYFERDPWIGGGRNLVRELSGDEHAEEWLTSEPFLGLMIGAEDAVSKPAQMKLRVGNGEWSKPEPYATWKEVPFPAGAALASVSLSVSDAEGNWSAPKTIMARLLNKRPALKGKPAIYANNSGVVIAFETDSACLARIEYGPDRKYGSVLEQPKDVQHSWISSDGGDYVATRSNPRVTNHLVLVTPAVVTGKTYHYRLALEDELGNKSVTEDATFTVGGEGKSYFVSPQGEDADAPPTREKPWRTIQFAVDRALPGDRVILLPGFYAGETKLTHGGMKDAPITIESDQPDTVILDARHESQSCLQLERAPEMVIKGLEIRWFAHSGVYVVDSPNVSVLNCRIWNDFWGSVWLEGYGIFAHRSPGMTVDHNVIYGFEFGILLVQSAHSRVTFNTILQNLYGAVGYAYSVEGTVARNNSFAYSGTDQYIVQYGDRKEMATFDSDYNNIGTRIGESYRPGATYDQGAVGAPEEFVAKDAFINAHHNSKALLAENGKRYQSLKAWQEATGKDKHTIFADPTYADAEHFDFRLKPGSPNIGAGENGATIGALGVKEN